MPNRTDRNSAALVLLAASALAQSPSPIHSISLLPPPNVAQAESTLVPDVDADGFDDVLVRQAGQTRIVSGRTGGVLRTLAAGNAGLGRDAGPVGDVDGDGVGDVAAADHTAYPQLVRVFSGATGAVIRTINDPTNIFGYSVSGVGDLNADGVPDIAVGAPYSNAGGSLSGRAFVYSGANGALLMLLPGTAANEQLGLNVAAAGDVNLDGTPDVLVSGTSTIMTANGVVRVYSGVNGAVLLTMSGSGNFGFSTASAGDLNGDGRPDILVGSPNFGAGGRVQLRSGFDGSVLMTLNGAAGTAFGAAVARLGDFDADGASDFLVGAPGALLPTSGLTAAALHVRSGFDGSPLASIGGPSIGFEAGAGGDVDQDGRPDFTVNELSGSLVMTTRVFSAAVFEVDPQPGSGEDLVLASTLDGAYGPDAIKFAASGDALHLHLASPNGTLQPYHALLVGQLIVTAQGVVSDPGVPVVHFDFAAVAQPVFLYDSAQGYFGTPGLPPGGLSLFVGLVPAGLGGHSVVVQGFSVAGPAAANGVFAATSAHEIRLPY